MKSEDWYFIKFCFSDIDLNILEGSLDYSVVKNLLILL